MAIIIIILLLIPSASWAKNLYVNNSGSPACSDSTTYVNNDASNPWCGLLRASRGNTDGDRNTAGVSAAAAQAGDTVLVTAGTYTYTGAYWAGDSWLAVLYAPVNSGTSGAWITFRAVGIVTLTMNSMVSGQPGYSSSATIGSNTNEYIEWDGFTMNEATSPWKSGLINVNADNMIIRNMRLIGQYRALGGDNHSAIMIHYGSVTAPGFCDGQIDNATITNNTISGVTGDSNINDAGIKMYCIGNNVIISNNEIYNSHNGIQHKTERSAVTGVQIKYNYIHDNTYNGIVIQSPAGWNIYQNVITGNSTCFHMMNTQYYFDFPTTLHPFNINFVNNTCYNNDKGVYIEGYCNNMYDNLIQNNLIRGSSATYGIYSEPGDLSSCQSSTHVGQDDLGFNYNFWQHSGDFYSNDGGGSVVSFATWTSTWGQDVGSSTSTDPLFVDAAGGNFRLQGGSPAINAGIDILDLDGDSSTVDAITIGAYITGNEVIGVDSSSSSVVRMIGNFGTSQRIGGFGTLGRIGGLL